MIVLLSHDQILDLVTQAARAPSAHNIQPARWRFHDGGVELLEDPARWLCNGDPTGRDNQIALGMAWEGMGLALSRTGLALAEPEIARIAYPPLDGGPRIAAFAALSRNGMPDPLAEFVGVRRCHRGAFAPSDASLGRAINECVQRHATLASLVPVELHDPIANWYDEAAIAGLHNAAFVHELRYWTRFSRRDRDWSRDGLSAECLALTHAEAFLARLVLRPRVLRAMLALGMGGLVASEAKKIRNATAIVALRAKTASTDFEAGRAWYRFWLDLARAGVAGVPMSALIDSPRHAGLIADSYPLPPHQRAINFMRLGPAPAGGSAISARLPATELLIS